MKKRLLTICNRFTLRFLINFAVILALPLGVFGLAYTFLNRMAQDQAYQENLTFFNQSGMMINTFFIDVQNLVSQMSNDNQIAHFLKLANAAEDGTSLSDVILSASQLRNNYKMNSAIHDLYVYSSASGMAIGKRGIEIHRDRLWDTLLPFLDYTPEQLRSIAENLRQDVYLPVTTLYDNKETRMILYMHQLQIVPFVYLYGTASPISGGVLIAVFRQDALDSQLRNNYFVTRGGAVTVTDTTGNYIAGNQLDSADQASITAMIDGRAEQDNGYFECEGSTDNLFVCYSSAPQGWRYIAVMPQSTLFARLRVSNSISLTVFLATFLLGLAVALFLSFRMARPLNSLYQTIGSENRDDQHGDVFGAIGRYLEDLRTENKTKDQLLARQTMQTRHLILYRLLYGSFDHESEYEAFARRHGLMPLTGSFLPILICVGASGEQSGQPQSDQLQLAKIIVREESGRVFSTDQIEDIDYNSIVLVYHFDEIGTRGDAITDILDDGINELSTRLKVKYGISIAAYGGSICTSPMQISQAFRQARQAMERIAPIDGGIIWFHEEPQAEIDYYYPTEVEKSLISSIRNGETEDMLRTLERINFENTYRMQLSADTGADLALQLRKTFDRLIRQIYSSEVPGAISQLQQSLQAMTRFEQVLDVLRHLGREIAEDVNRKRSENRWQVVEKVMELVDRHFADNTFGLEKLSRMIGYSEPYLSSLFHTATGEQFSRYLERVRLSEACRLLEKEKIPAEQIAIQVGYGSANAFRRAFKKIYSLTPGEFRERAAVTGAKADPA